MQLNIMEKEKNKTWRKTVTERYSTGDQYNAVYGMIDVTETETIDVICSEFLGFQYELLEIDAEETQETISEVRDDTD